MRSTKTKYKIAKETEAANKTDSLKHTSTMILWPMVIGVGLSFLLFLSTQYWERERLKNKFTNTTISYDLVIKDALDELKHEIETIKYFYESSSKVTLNEFTSFTNHIASNPAIQAVEWIPQVAYADKAQHEKEIRKQGFKNYSIKEMSPNGKLINVSKRQFYYPVTFINPIQNNKQAHGFDLGSNPARLNALKTTRNTGQVISSEPVSLIQTKDKKRQAVLLFAPFYGTDNNPLSLNRRQKEIKSFLIAVFYIDVVIESALKNIKSQGLNISLSDVTSSSEKKYLHHHVSRSINHENNLIFRILNTQTNLEYISTINFSGRKWEIHYSPVEHFYHTNSSWYASIIFLSGLAITLFTTMLINTLQRRNLQTKKLNILKSEQFNDIQVAQNAMLDAMADGLIIITSKGIIEAFNLAAEKIFGYNSEELIGKKINTLMPDHISAKHDHYLQSSQLKDKVITLNNRTGLQAVRKNGEIFPISLSLKAMNVDGNLKYTGVLRDISEQYKNEQELIQAKEKAEVAAKAKSNFLATMSHEIRTPMNGIIGMLQILEDTKLNDKQKDQVSIIDSSAKALLAIINDILDFSKIEAEKLNLSPEPCDLQEIASRSLAILKNKADEKDLQLNLVFGKNCPYYFLADAGRIRQVLLNLLGNAIKFTQQGGVSLKIDLIKKNKNDASLRIEIIDTGIGISESAQESLFDSFTQVDNGMQRQFGGTGLGLAISKQLITLMNGEIGVKSSTDDGTTFWFELSLPLSEAPQNKISQTNEKINFTGKILLVEDNIVNEKIMNAMLGKLNIQYEHAGNGEEAIKKWADDDFDLILMDCQMPIMDGFEATKIIRENEAQKNQLRIPIIALTANVLEIDKENCTAAGMDAHLAKPVIFATLQETLCFWLTKSKESITNLKKSKSNY